MAFKSGFLLTSSASTSKKKHKSKPSTSGSSGISSHEKQRNSADASATMRPTTPSSSRKVAATIRKDETKILSTESTSNTIVNNKIKKQRKGKNQTTMKKGFLLTSSSSKAAKEKKALHLDSIDLPDQNSQHGFNDAGGNDSVVLSQTPQSMQSTKANRIVKKSQASSKTKISSDLLCFENDDDADVNANNMLNIDNGGKEDCSTPLLSLLVEQDETNTKRIGGYMAADVPSRISQSRSKPAMSNSFIQVVDSSGDQDEPEIGDERMSGTVYGIEDSNPLLFSEVSSFTKKSEDDDNAHNSEGETIEPLLNPRLTTPMMTQSSIVAARSLESHKRQEKNRTTAIDDTARSSENRATKMMPRVDASGSSQDDSMLSEDVSSSLEFKTLKNSTYAFQTMPTNLPKHDNLANQVQTNMEARDRKEMDLNTFQQQLEETIWRLSNSSEIRKAPNSHNCSTSQQPEHRRLNICRDFVKGITRENSQRLLPWAWNWVLQLENERRETSRPDIDTNARLIIGQELLLQCPTGSWQTIATHLDIARRSLGTDNSEKQLRINALQVLQFLSQLLEISTGFGNTDATVVSVENNDVLREWIDIVLPRLMTLATHGDGRRTVLTHTAWRSTLEWISFACDYVVDASSTSQCSQNETAADERSSLTDMLTVKLWTEAAPCLDELLELQIVWKRGSTGQEESTKVKGLDIDANVNMSRDENQDFLVILKDWRTIYDYCKKVYQDQIRQQQDDGVLELGCTLPNFHPALLSGSLWCQFVKGISLEPAGISDPDNDTPGIHSGVGGLRQTILWSSLSMKTTMKVQWRMEDALSWLKLAQQSLSEGSNDPSSSSEEKPSNSSSVENNNQMPTATRPLLRGVLACSYQWRLKTSRLRKKKKPASRNVVFLTDEQRQELVVLCLRALSRCRSDEDISLALGVLNCIWSDSDGLPPDIIQAGSDPHEIPHSFDMLLSTLQEEASLSSSGKIDDDVDDSVDQHKKRSVSPTGKALANMVSKCILVSENRNQGLKLAKYLVTQHGSEKDTTLCVLLSILAEQRITFQSQSITQLQIPSTEDASNDQDRLLRFAWSVILDRIPSSSFLREELRGASSRVFFCVDMELVIPRLVTILARHLAQCGQKRDKDCIRVNDTIDTACLCLTRVMEQLAVHSRLKALDSMVRLVTQAVEAVEAEQDGDKNNTSDSSFVQRPLVGRLCSSFLGRWRRSLLETSSVGNGAAFGNVLISLSKEFMNSPSNLVMLTIFGGFVGDSMNETFVNDQREVRIARAVDRLVELCVEKLRDSQAAKDVFGCLSPLLLLRRVPTAYFQISRNYLRHTDRKTYHSRFSSLADCVAIRLDLGSHGPESGSLGAGDFSTEERRLAAEIAGRCLPFGSTVDDDTDASASSVFTRICTPAFGAALQVMEPNEMRLEERTYAIKVARAALYATCHHIPSVSGDLRFNGDYYRLTASFVFSMLRINAEEKGSDSAFSDAIVKLQTGCIEFVAICIEKTLREQAVKPSNGTDIMSELPVSSAASITRKGYSSKESLDDICRSTISILQTGNFVDAWLDSSVKHFLKRASTYEADFPVSARICLWNAFVVVSQRCNNDEGQLDRFAKVTVPWVVEWCVSGSAGLELRHPLCLAAAMQVIFQLTTKTKSLLYFNGASEKGTRKESVRQVHRWALNVVRRDTRYPGGDYSNRALRLSGLKLVLAIFTVDQAAASDELLGPAVITETCTVLSSVANMDTDSEVRELAAGLLRAVQVH